MQREGAGLRGGEGAVKEVAAEDVVRATPAGGEDVDVEQDGAGDPSEAVTEKVAARETDGTGAAGFGDLIEAEVDLADLVRVGFASGVGIAGKGGGDRDALVERGELCGGPRRQSDLDLNRKGGYGQGRRALCGWRNSCAGEQAESEREGAAPERHDWKGDPF